MAALGRFFGKFFGRTIGDAASFAIGGSISRTIDPVLQQVENEAWLTAVAAGAVRPLDAGDAAEVVAEDVEKQGWGESQAAQGGIGAAQFDALVQAVLNAPGVPQLLTLWRRGVIADADFVHGLRKARLEGRWDAPLESLKLERLAPNQVALGIVRSVIADPGLLVTTLDTSDSNVPQYEPLNLDALEEAMASGIDRERLRGMVGEIGLPMPVVRAANAVFRGILTRGAYNQAVLEGDTRPEWGDAIFEEARQIITAHDGIEDHLRGWSDAAAMYAQTARHGMSQADTDILFRITGRPLSWHQVFIGLRRGGTYDGPIADIDPAFLKALRESNIRPEWYNLAWAQRYSYPAAFVLKALTVGGDLTGAEAETILLYEGWEPSLAAKVSAAWSAPKTPAGTDKHVTSATTSLITSTRRAYVGGAIDKPQAVTALTTAGVPVTSQNSLFTLWDAERTVETAPPPA